MTWRSHLTSTVSGLIVIREKNKVLLARTKNSFEIKGVDSNSERIQSSREYYTTNLMRWGSDDVIELCCDTDTR